MRKNLANFMPKSNTVLAAAIMTALAGAPMMVQAQTTDTKTSTVKGAFIADVLSASAAGGIVNLSIMGLNKTGEVDLEGGNFGSTLYVVVTSTHGQVMGGYATVEQMISDIGKGPAKGDFAATVAYLPMVQGKVRAHVKYNDINVAGQTDTMTIKMMERFQNVGGGITVNEIASTTKTVTVTAPASGAKILDVVSVDVNGDKAADDTNTDGMVVANIIAGQAGTQFTMKAYKSDGITVDTNTYGSVELQLVKKGDAISKGAAAVPAYKFKADMTAGEAIVTLDNTVTKEDEYYLKAVFTSKDGKTTLDSVDLFSNDVLKVADKGIPVKLKLSEKYGKTKVSNDGNDLSSVTVYAYLMDEYGNTTTVPAGTNTVKITDANGVALAAPVTVTMDSATDVNKSAALVLGNTAQKFAKTSGAAALSASIVNRSDITAADALEFTVVEENLTAAREAATTQSQKADAIFDAFDVRVDTGDGVYQATDKALSSSASSTVVVKSLTKTVTKGYETIETAIDPNTSLVRGRFQGAFSTATPGAYLLSDKNGTYGQVVVIDAYYITPGNPIKAEVRNAINEAVSTVEPVAKTVGTSTQYEVKLYEKSIKMLDSVGNQVTPDKASVGTVFAETDSKKGSVAGTGGATADLIPGSDDTGYLTVTYQSEGTTAFAGDDKVNFIFTVPGINNSPVATTVPAPSKLTKVEAKVEQAAIPANGEVAVTVLSYDQNGKLFNPTNEGGVKMAFTAGGQATPLIPNVKDVSGVTVVNGANVDLATGRKVLVVNGGPVTGGFGLEFMGNKDSTIKSTVDFTVTKEVVQDCGPTAMGLCKTEATCTTAGGVWNGTACATPATPVAKDSLGSAELSAGVPAILALTADAKVDPKDPNITWMGGIAVNGGTRNKTASITGKDDVKVSFTATVPTALVGKKADVATVILWIDDNTGPNGVFLWWNGVNKLMPWDLDMAKIGKDDMTPFKTVASLGATETVDVFSGKLENLPGTAIVFVGFITDNKLYFNGTKPENFVTLSIAP